MDDVISRQKAINVIERMRAYIGHNMERAVGAAFIEILDDVGEDIERLPSALGTNLAEVGTDLISRQAAIEAAMQDVSRIRTHEFNAGATRAANRIKQLPSAEPKKGKWIRDGHHIRCDQCGMYMCDTDREGDRIPTEFCPHCGAKMEVTE